MNVQIKHKGLDISEYVIKYLRNQNICSGIGTLDITLSGNYPNEIKTWDRFVLYEEDRLVGIYYVNIFSVGQPKGDIEISCQDGTKRLNDYFIDKNEIVDYFSRTGYWIHKYLTDAGVEHTIDEDSGVALSNNTSLGMTSCYEQLMSLIQMNGWYMRFDGDVCHIGDRERGPSDIRTSLTPYDILEITKTMHDKMLRNRALVMGGTDPITGEWYHADKTKHTHWEYDNADIRTAVVSNGYINSTKAANKMARDMLSAFDHITIEKRITAHGARDILLGEYISVQSNTFTGVGLVTSIGSSMSSSGLVTNIVLDERCPRLFACFSVLPSGLYPLENVYISSTEHGVMKKALIDLTPSGWTDFSTGLTNLNIVDLYVNNGVMSCVDSDGNAWRAYETEGIWRRIHVVGLQYAGTEWGTEPDTEFVGLPVVRAVIQDKNNNSIRLAVDNRPPPAEWDYFNWGSYQVPTVPGNLAWVVDINPYDGGMLGQYQIISPGFSELTPIIKNVSAYDIENDGANDFVSVLAQDGYIVPEPGSEYSYGDNEHALHFESGKNIHVPTSNFENTTFTNPYVDNSFDWSVGWNLVSYDNIGDRELVYPSRYTNDGRHTYPLSITRIQMDYLTGEVTDYREIPLGGSSSRNFIGCCRITKEGVYNVLIHDYGSGFKYISVDFSTGTILSESAYHAQWAYTGSNIYTANLELLYYTTARFGNLIYGLRIDKVDEYLTNVYGYYFDLTTMSTTSSIVYTLAGTLDAERDEPVNVELGTLTSYAAGGMLAKLSLMRMVKNSFTERITSCTISILNLFGSFSTYEETRRAVSTDVSDLYTAKFNQRSGLFYGPINSYYNCFGMGIRDSLGVSVIIKSAYPAATNWEAITAPSYGFNYMHSDTGNVLTDKILIRGQATADIMGYVKNLNNGVDITLSAPGYTSISLLKQTDQITSEIIAVAKLTGFTDTYILSFNLAGSLTHVSPKIYDMLVSEPESYYMFTSNNFLILGKLIDPVFLYNASTSVHPLISKTVVKYMKVAEVTDGLFVYLFEVFRRTGNVFDLVHVSLAADRLDISDKFPLVTMGMSLNDAYVLPNDKSLPPLTGVVPIVDNGLPLELVSDFRYYQYFNTETYIDALYLIYTTPRGVIRRIINDDQSFSPSEEILVSFDTGKDPTQIETTARLSDEQILFTTSDHKFYQNTYGSWENESLYLPDDIEITRIRVSDSL